MLRLQPLKRKQIAANTACGNTGLKYLARDVDSIYISVGTEQEKVRRAVYA